MIIGRTTELKYLNNYYDRAGSQILVVYGQKHVGKKALLKEFGSVEKIKKASKEELMQVKGITEKIVEQIKK